MIHSLHLIYPQLVLTKSYTTPPTLDITLEEFETFAINRLRILSYIESLQHRSLPYTQFQTQLSAYLKQYLPLSSNTARSVDLVAERRGDEIGHWVLRLAFCRSYVPLPSFLSFF
jgi:DNA primase large subunit